MARQISILSLGNHDIERVSSYYLQNNHIHKLGGIFRKEEIEYTLNKYSKILFILFVGNYSQSKETHPRFA